MRSLQTNRFLIRAAQPRDAEVYLALWTDPRVMGNVGFPEGLNVTREEILERIEAQEATEFDRLLVVERRADGRVVGECMLHPPNRDGIASTDIKLLPEFWGHGYGTEVKRALLDYLFRHTDCTSVEATPNVENTASIRMQEAVGGRRIREDLFEFPEGMKVPTRPVRHFVYRVMREDWERRP